MKKVFLFGFAGLLILFATGIFARLLLTHTDMIARFPDAVWAWLENLYGGVEDAEDMAGLETLVSLILSFIVVSLVTLSGWFLWRRIKAR